MAKPRRRKPRGVTSRRSAKERKRKTGGIVIGLLLAFLMVFSIVGVLNHGQDSTEIPYTYGEYEFRLETRNSGGQVLVTEISGEEIEFQSLPPQVTYLEVDPQAISALKNAPQVALVADPLLDSYDAGNVDYVRLQLSLALQKTVNAMSRSTGNPQQAVLNCSQATPQLPIVQFNITNATTRISLNQDCITLSAVDRELMLLKDRLIFEYYGIMQDEEVGE